MKIRKININRIFTIFLFSHLIVWTLIPTFSNNNLPLDVIEAIAWSDGWPWHSPCPQPSEAAGLDPKEADLRLKGVARVLAPVVVAESEPLAAAVEGAEAASDLDLSPLTTPSSRRTPPRAVRGGLPAGRDQRPRLRPAGGVGRSMSSSPRSATSW